MKPIRLFNFVQMDNGIDWLFLLAVFVSTLLRAFQKAARPLNELARGFPIAGSGPPVVTPVGGRDPERVGNRWRERKKEKLRFDFGIRSMQPWFIWRVSSSGRIFWLGHRFHMTGPRFHYLRSDRFVKLVDRLRPTRTILQEGKTMISQKNRTSGAPSSFFFSFSFHSVSENRSIFSTFRLSNLLCKPLKSRKWKRFEPWRGT